MGSSRRHGRGTSASPPTSALWASSPRPRTPPSVYKEGGGVAYLLLYVDDFVLTASSTDLLRRITDRLHSEFAMTDLGDLHHFLGISVTRSPNGLFLSQRQYVVDLLQHVGMAECHSTATPVDTRAKLSATDSAPIEDATQYRSLVGALQYLTLTRPDIAYAVQQVCLFMDDPREPHLAMLKRILRYVKGTLSTSLHIGTGPVDSLTTYSDEDWAGCPDSQRSTSGYCVFLGDNLVFWSSKRQTTGLSTVLWHMPWLRHVGFVSFSRSFMRPSLRQRSSTVTMSVPCT